MSLTRSRAPQGRAGEPRVGPGVSTPQPHTDRRVGVQVWPLAGRGAGWRGGSLCGVTHAARTTASPPWRESPCGCAAGALAVREREGRVAGWRRMEGHGRRVPRGRRRTPPRPRGRRARAPGRAPSVAGDERRCERAQASSLGASGSRRPPPPAVRLAAAVAVRDHGRGGVRAPPGVGPSPSDRPGLRPRRGRAQGDPPVGQPVAIAVRPAWSTTASVFRAGRRRPSSPRCGRHEPDAVAPGVRVLESDAVEAGGGSAVGVQAVVREGDGPHSLLAS